MKTVKIGSHTIEMYDNIEQLPVARYHKFNKMMLLASGVGSDMSDIFSHIDKAIRYCRKNPDDAIKELQNLAQAIELIKNEVSPRHLAFCALVKTIDGELCEDISDDGLQQTLKKLGNSPQSDLTAATEGVKKKIEDELTAYFPKIFDGSEKADYSDRLRQMLFLKLDSIIDGKDRDKAINDLEDQLVLWSRPKSFIGSSSAEVYFDREYENMCLLISKELNADSKKMTVLEYYNALEYLKRQAKEQNRRIKKSR